MLSEIYLLAFWDIYHVREGFTLFWDIFYSTNTRQYIFAHSDIYLPIIRNFASFWDTIKFGTVQYCTVPYGTVQYILTLVLDNKKRVTFRNFRNCSTDNRTSHI